MLRRIPASPFLAAACLLTACAAAPAADPSDDPHDGGVYIISNLHSGKRLAIADGGKDNGDKVVQDDRTRTHVTWRLEKVGNGYFHIVNTSSGRGLEVPYDNADKSAVQLQQWDISPDTKAYPNQVWEFVKFGEHYAIRCKMSSLVMNPKTESTADGAAVIQYGLTDDHRSNDLWILTEVRK